MMNAKAAEFVPFTWRSSTPVLSATPLVLPQQPQQQQNSPPSIDHEDEDDLLGFEEFDESQLIPSDIYDYDDDQANIDEFYESQATLNPLDLLELIFTDSDRQTLMEALEENQYDVEATVKHLLQVSDDGDAAIFDSTQSVQQKLSAPKAQPVVKPKQGNDVPICKYFLKGSCLIKNCQFRHTSQVACKYFLQGFCFRGDECDFLHTIDPSSVSQVFAEITLEDKPKSIESASSAQSINMTEFPSLSNQHPDSPSQSFRRKQPDGFQDDAAFLQFTNGKDYRPPMRKEDLTLAAKLKLSQLQERFSHVSRETVAQLFLAYQCSMDQATSALIQMYGDSQRITGAPISQSPPQRVESTRRSSATNMYDKSATILQQGWVDTGSNVAKLYEEYRTEAIEHARLRNKYFDIATTSYLRGDGATAREFSRKGRFHQNKMKELHRLACEKIFQIRNQNINDLYNGSTIDLHGLHVTEAVNYLEDYIAAIVRNPSIKFFYIITGTGHHTFDARSRLAPAVRQVLSQYPVEISDCSTDQRGGMLRVKMTNRS